LMSRWMTSFEWMYWSPLVSCNRTCNSVGIGPVYFPSQ
jgi:hypothetical protein